MSKFIAGHWLSEAAFRSWRIEHSYERYANYQELLQRIPRLSLPSLDAFLRVVQADLAHPAFWGPDADVTEQMRHQTLRDLLHAERGYRLVHAAFQRGNLDSLLDTDNRVDNALYEREKEDAL